MDAELLIVGGGLSGLALAGSLDAAGRDYRLIEARPRLGGRVLSTPAPGGGPARFDLGPAWFWPGQRRMAALARGLDLPVFSQHAAGATAFEAGDGAIRRDLDFALNGEAFRIEGGLTALIERMAASLPPERLTLGAEARRLSRRPGGWTAEIGRDGVPGALEAISAKTIVLAAPPRIVAETIRVEPALPDAALAALRATPTWMAGHAKAIALYERPFWRDAGLSGDAISHRGPLAQIHDASPMRAEDGPGALFGFFGLDAAARRSIDEAELRGAATRQLERIFGPAAAAPLAVIIQDWSRERFTAVAADADAPTGHPSYGPAPALDALEAEGLAFSVTELAPEDGGLLEGALAAADRTAARLTRARNDASVV